MSAFVVGKSHIDFLVTYADLHRRSMWENILDRLVVRKDKADDLLSDLDLIGRALWSANIASVRYRYPNERADELPGPVGVAFAAAGYRYRAHRLAFGCQPDVLLKALSCFEYQSCERPDWNGSDEHQFCVHLRDAAISALPGYAEAPWQVPEAEGEAPNRIMSTWASREVSK